MNSGRPIHKAARAGIVSPDRPQSVAIRMEELNCWIVNGESKTKLIPIDGVSEGSSWPAAGAANPKSDSEAWLLTRLRHRDEWAFETLVHDYHERMHRVAYRVLHNEEDSADAVQEAFLAVFLSIGSFEGNSRLWTWLYRILLNICLKKLQSRSRRRELRLDDLHEASIDARQNGDAAGWRAEPAFLSIDRRETEAEVRMWINRLPYAYRRVVTLREIEELDTDQTARTLCISRSAVKSRLHRAREALRVLLTRAQGEACDCDSSAA
jgi:RNA polymerase sigma-70 factor, ECF subfamily